MDPGLLLNLMDDAVLAALFGLVTGIVVGMAAQRSSLCLGASTVVFARGQLGPRMAAWR